jgi:CDP-diacylglycerol--glycerol-3-phosphate 3-phosphatidyltransferase
VGTRLGWDEYASRWAALHGGFDPRQAGTAVRGWVRLSYEIGSRLGRLGITPTPVTVVGLLLCALVPIAATRAPSGLFAAAILVLLAAVADSVDGAVAVATDRATRLGYVYDSVADRLGEICWLVAFWVAGAPAPLVFTAGALSWLHEYIRARATAAGMTEIGTVTVGERPSRVSVTVVAFIVAAAAGGLDKDLTPGTLTVFLAIWVLLAAFGLTQLFRAVRRLLR